MYQNITSPNDYDANHELPSTHSDGTVVRIVNSAVSYYFQLKATLNSDDVRNGNQIFLGSVNSKNSSIPISLDDHSNSGDSTDVYDQNNNQIGTLIVTGNGTDQVNYYLKVTTNKQYSDDVNVTIRHTLFNIKINNNLFNISNLKGVPTVHVVLTPGDKQYTIDFSVPKVNEKTASRKMTNTAESLQPWGAGVFIYANPGFSEDSIDEDLTGISDPVRESPKDVQQVIEYNGVNFPTDFSKINIRGREQNIRMVDAEGKMTDEYIDYMDYVTPRKVKLEDNLSPDQALKNTPSNSVGFSHQTKNGNNDWIVAYNIPESYFKLNRNNIIDNIKRFSILYNVQEADKKEQVLNNTLNYWFNINKGMPYCSVFGVEPSNDSPAGLYTYKLITPTNLKTSNMVLDYNPHTVRRTVGSTAGDGQYKNYLVYQFVDDTTGTNVGSPITESGKAGTTGSLNLKVPDGYELAKGQTLPTSYTIPNQDTVVQIHLTHAPKPVNAAANAIRTIHYVIGADGTGGKAFDDKPQDVSFSGTVDSITDNPISLKPNGQWDQVVSPDLKGYTPDIKVVNAETPSPNQRKEVTVHYLANDEKAKLRVIDDHTSLELAGYSEEAAGKFDTAISFDKNPNDVAKELENKGYKVVSNSWQDGSKYQDGKNEFVIHVDHTTSTQTETHAQTRTIHYVDGKGNKMSDDVVQRANFTRTGTKDNVTGQIDWKDWTTNDKYAEVYSPVHDGYTPDIKVVQSDTPDPNKNKTVTVTYTANDERAKLRVIDDHTGLELNGYDEEANGKYDTAISFTKNPNDVAKELENKGYKVVSNSWKDGSKYQDGKNEFAIHVDHTTSAQTESHAQTRTIHYVDGKGNKMNDDVIQKANFTRTGTKDNVTGQIDWKDWTTNDKYTGVSSPVHDGYTPDKVKVDAVTPLYGQNQDQTVVYHRNGQGAEITYVDDTTGKVLKHEQAQGKYNDKIIFNSNVPDTIKGYENDGYVLVSNNFKDQNYSSDNATNKFTVHFKHGTKQVTRDKNASQDIDYQIKENGTTHSVNHYKAPDLKFTQSGVQDTVTKEINWNGTVADQQFKAVNTPTIKGYTPDIKQVPTTNIHVDSKNWNQDQNIKKTVTYTPDTETVKVIAKDRDTNKILNQSQLTGTYGSEYHATAPKITGYHLVKSPANASGKFGTDNEDVVYLYVKDTPTDKGETAGTPKPDDTSVFNQNLSKQDTKDLPEMSEANMATATLAGLGLLALTGLVPVIKRKIRN